MYVTTVCLMVLAGTISATLFMSQSLRLDEAQTLWQTNRYPDGILYVVGQDVHVPLYHLTIYIWQVIFGNSIDIVRILSVLFFIITIPCVVLLGNQLFQSRRVSLFGAAIFTLSPFMNWYGNEARMYSMLVFFTVLNQYFFVRLRKEYSLAVWIGYGLTAIAGMYTHYYFGLVLLTQALFYVAHTKLFPKYSFRNFFLTATAVALTIAPWILYVRYLGKISNSEPLLQSPTTIDLFNTFAQFMFGIQSIPINSFIVSLWPLVMLAWLFSLQKREKTSIDAVYLIYSIVVPIFLSFGISIMIRPVFQARYLIFTLPAFSLTLAAMIDSCGPFLRRILSTLMIIGLLVALLIISYNPETPTKENFSEVASYLETHANPQDVIIVSAPFTIYPLQYYYQGPTRVSTLPIWNQFITGPIPAFNPATFPEEVRKVVGSHQRAWLLLSYDQGYEKTIRTYFDNHFERLEQSEVSPGMTLALYKLRYDTDVSIYKSLSK